MIQELAAAGQCLQDALDGYFSVCSAIQGYFIQENRHDGVLQALSDRVANELELVSAFETRLKQSKAAISTSRNYHTALVPINILPSEILTRIFRLILDAQPRTRHDEFAFPKYPDQLSHVCSRWRQITLHSPTLWSYIDLAPCHPHFEGLLTRAAVCANRARDLPLLIRVVHIGGLGDIRPPVYNGLEQFLASMATRMASLELLADGPVLEGDPTGDLSTLRTCIKHSTPGVLTQLTIRNTSTPPTPVFLRDGGTISPGPNELLLDQSCEALTGLWRPITILRLNGVYPDWNSVAYHGLVELRLTHDGAANMSMSESQFVSILASSPRLSIFQFERLVVNQIEPDATVTPVHLDDLEVLAMTIKNLRTLGCLLRWIAPGSKPLQVSLTGWSYPCMADDRVRAFLARSNTINLRLISMNVSNRDMGTVLDLSPNLRVFILQRVFWYHVETMPVFDECAGSSTRLSTDRLYLLDSIIPLNKFKRFLQGNPVRTLTTWNSVFDSDHPGQGASRPGGPGEIKELGGYCSTLEFLTGERPPRIDEWDCFLNGAA